MPQFINYINMLIMAELIIGEHLFSFTRRKRQPFPMRPFALTVGCLLIAFVFPVPSGDSALLIIGWGTLMYVTFFCLSGIALYYSYDEDFWTILFCMVAGQSLQNLSSCVRSTLVNFFELTGMTVPFIGSQLVFIPIYVLCYLHFRKRLKKNPDFQINNLAMLILAGTAVFIELVLALVIHVLASTNAQPAYLTLVYLYASFACVFILHIEFGLMENKALESQLTVAQQLMKEREKQYELSQKNIQLINIKCHDLKHQIRYLRDGGAIMDSRSLEELESAVNIYDAAPHTGCNALDVLLTEKSLIAEKEGIRLTCMAEGEKLSFMADADIYALFGNAIDNAIEALMKLNDRTKRNLSINVREDRNMLMIHVENYYAGDLASKNGTFETTKDNKELHGYGIKSMELIAEKYGGYMSINAENEIFHLHILFPFGKI